MEDVLMLVYESACAVVPCAVALCIMSVYVLSAGCKPHVAQGVLMALFVAAVAAVLHFTGVGTVYEAIRLGVPAQPMALSLIPGAGGGSRVECMLNIALFVPVGFLLPLAWPAWRKPWRTALFGAGLSVAVELSQLLNFRCTDVDDLLLNTAGVVVGYAIFACVQRCLQLGEQTTGKRNACTVMFQSANLGLTHGAAVPLVITATMFLGRIMLFNEMGFASILWGL